MSCVRSRGDDRGAAGASLSVFGVFVQNTSME